jgi:hypothetical protein
VMYMKIGHGLVAKALRNAMGNFVGKRGIIGTL